MRRTIMHAVSVASLVVMFSCLAAAAQEPDATLTVHTAASMASPSVRWTSAAPMRSAPCTT